MLVPIEFGTLQWPCRVSCCELGDQNVLRLPKKREEKGHDDCYRGLKSFTEWAVTKSTVNGGIHRTTHCSYQKG